MPATARAPRLVPDVEAAAYVGVPVATYLHWVACGLMPKPIESVNLYDIKAIDLALDRLSGIGSPTNALDAWRLRRAG